MSFAYWWILPLLVIPAALLAWTWSRRGGLVLPFDHGKPGTGRGWWIVLSIADCLPALLLAVVIIILSGPQRLAKPETKRQVTNIELLVDVSGSMMTPFGDGSRYDMSMKAIDEFLDFRKGDAVGLTFFGSDFIHWVPLTTDASAIRCAPPFMRPEIAPPWMGGTMIGKALRGCKKVLTERQEGKRMIVLISDGDSFDLDSGNDMEIAKELKNNDIVVYEIHISDEGIPDAIANITGITGGEVFNPGDPEALKAVFRKIDQLQKIELERSLAEVQDWFFPFCVAGLSVLGTMLLCWFGIRGTPW
jgi:Ca-activated chloride channel family protein